MCSEPSSPGMGREAKAEGAGPFGGKESGPRAFGGRMNASLLQVQASMAEGETGAFQVLGRWAGGWVQGERNH